MANRRKIQQRRLKPTIHISCEGANTEEDYLKILKTTFPLDNYNIKIIGQNRNKSDPINILKYHQEKVKKSGPNKNYYPHDIEVIILDREENNNRITEQFNKLKKWQREGENRILIVNSTCFEYWLLLHFVEKPKCSTTKRILETLKNHLPKYNKSLKGIKFGREEILTASERARNKPSLYDIIQSGLCGSNMYDLVDLLIRLEEREKKN
ncbi:RloB family protein [Lagierella sp.]|uniref:RloB family protein n=1 Tax=Lagierella sp. TaxID=2849657 RepID=UPI00261B2348|nr:RloB family protein [Lagierella sp.]